MYRFLIIIISLTVTACVQMGPVLPEIALPPERIWFESYSILPLNEVGWIIGGRDSTRAMLGKHGESPDETNVIESSLVIAPIYKDDATFIKFVRESQEADTNPDRFNPLRHEFSTTNKDDNPCVISHLAAEDTQAKKRSGKSGDMILEMKVLTCYHVRREVYLINVVYSQRYYQGFRDPKFDEKASYIFDNVWIK